MTARIGVSYVREGSGRNYLDALREAGAEPMVLFTEESAPQWPTADQAKALFDPRNPAFAMFDDLDGLLLTGGGDIDPMLYREEMNGSDVPSWPRDHLEMAQFRRARARSLPVFGICRGFQFLNVALGGSLVQDLATAEAHRDATWKVSHSHLVWITPDSVLARIIGDEKNDAHVVGVNSRHHQGVMPIGLAPGLIASAFSTALADDTGQLVEGIETVGTREGTEFVLGVQWHPERVADTAPFGERQSVTFAEISRRLFRAFVMAAEARRSGDERARRVLLQV
jgi:gamma-glutamyl-gamma-aminobutyrate hydrolase PuuD